MENNVIHTVDSGEYTPLNIAPSTATEEILQNLYMLLATVKGTVVLDRRFGITGEYVDKPLPAYESLIISEVYDAVAEYEPRVEIVRVEVEYDELKGSLKIRLQCTSPFFVEVPEFREVRPPKPPEPPEPPEPCCLPPPIFVPPPGEFFRSVDVTLESDYDIFISEDGPFPTSFRRYLGEVYTLTADKTFWAYAFDPVTFRFSVIVKGEYLVPQEIYHDFLDTGKHLTQSVARRPVVRRAKITWRHRIITSPFYGERRKRVRCAKPNNSDCRSNGQTCSGKKFM